MSLDPLLAITALDGRYRSKVEPLAAALSEFGLLHARVEVECRWFITLAATDGIKELPLSSSGKIDISSDTISQFNLTGINFKDADFNDVEKFSKRIRKLPAGPLIIYPLYMIILETRIRRGTGMRRRKKNLGKIWRWDCIMIKIPHKHESCESGAKRSFQ